MKAPISPACQQGWALPRYEVTTKSKELQTSARRANSAQDPQDAIRAAHWEIAFGATLIALDAPCAGCGGDT
jgi:hypothetical protein